MSKETSFTHEIPVQPEYIDIIETIPPRDILVPAYLGEMFLNKSMNEARHRNSVKVLDEIAKGYAYYPDHIQLSLLRTLTDLKLESNDGIRRSVALSQAEAGNYDEAEEYLPDVEKNNPDFTLSYARIVHKQGLNPQSLYQQAISDVGKEYESLPGLRKIIQAYRETEHDPEDAVTAYIQIAEKTKKSNRYVMDIKSYLTVLLEDGQIERAEEIVENQQIDSVTLGKISLLLAKAHITQGNGGYGISLLPTSSRYPASESLTVLKDCLQARNHDSDTEKLLRKTFDSVYQKIGSFGQPSVKDLLTKIEVLHAEGEDFEPLIENVMRKITQELPFEALQSVKKVIDFSEQFNLDTAPLYDLLYQTAAKVNIETEYPDPKLDAIETAMEYEYTIFYLSEKGKLAEAMAMTDLYQDVFAMDIVDKDIIVEAHASIGRNMFRFANTESTLYDSDESSYFKAIGYYGLPHPIAITQREQLWIEVGKQEKLVIAKGESESALLTNTAVDTSNEALEKSTDETTTSYDTRRMLKELLEVGDPKAKELAVTMFLDENQSLHFRTYLAKKLCAEGMWDREILYYFKSYEKEGKEKKDIHQTLETLETILTEMHQTPDLNLYKVLEKTREKKNTEAMEKIARFGAEVFLADELDVSDRIRIFSAWGDKYSSGKLSEKRLQELTKNIRGLASAWSRFHENRRKFDAHERLDQSMEYLTSNDVFQGVQEAETLFSHGFYPTKTLITHLKETEDIDALLELHDKTKNGQFDPMNKLQKELEFTTYLKLNSFNAIEYHYSLFNTLPFKKLDAEPTDLTLKEQYEAGAAAYECAKLYWFIRELSEQDRPIIVVGNKRYGEYFVTDPLRWELKKIGVRSWSMYAHSTNANETSYPHDLSDNFIRTLSQESPNVVIVDGSRNVRETGMRLPNSFHSFLNFFEGFNESVTADAETKTDPKIARLASYKPENAYAIKVWSPSGDTKAQLGNTVLESNEEDSEHPAVYFVNSVTSPKRDEEYPKELGEHIPGFFDDPETKIVSFGRIVLTPNGVKSTDTKRTSEEEYVRKVQDEIERRIPEYIRRTDPLNSQTKLQRRNVF